MEAAISGIGQLLKSKYFWWAVVALLVYIVIRRNYYKLQDLLAPSYVETTKDTNGHVVPISQVRKSRLVYLAREIYRQVTSFGPWDNFTVVDELSIATDAELVWAAGFYKEVLAKNQATLYDGLSNQFSLYGINSDNIIEVRLKQMGLT